MSLKELLTSWPDAPIVACKGCGKKMLFGNTYDDIVVPLDPSPPVYLLMPEDRKFKKLDGAYVSHFSTCPKANQF